MIFLIFFGEDNSVLTLVIQEKEMENIFSYDLEKRSDIAEELEEKVIRMLTGTNEEFKEALIELDDIFEYLQNEMARWLHDAFLYIPSIEGFIRCCKFIVQKCDKKNGKVVGLCLALIVQQMYSSGRLKKPDFFVFQNNEDVICKTNTLEKRNQWEVYNIAYNILMN